MRLPASEHTSRPWRIHDLVPDFRLEDVWGLEAPGRPDDFERGVRIITGYDPAQSSFAAVRALFALRWKVGGMLGWDDDDTGVGSRVPTLRDRLPEDLRATDPPEFAALPFSPLYMLEDEFAAEIANGTMHGVMHIGWVDDEEDDLPRGQAAVLVKTNGRFGDAYMAAIKPFRLFVVYPALMREGERLWRADEPVVAAS